MEYLQSEFVIYDQQDKVQLPQVVSLLKQSYWANERTLADIERSIKHSVCFSLYKNEQQIGFARVVTDYSTIAYICDVIIDSAFRGKGLGKWLTQTAINDPRWETLFQMLATNDAHTLYEQSGYMKSNLLMGKNI